MLLTRTRLIAAGLLITSTALFAAGAALERHSGGEAHETQPAASQAATPDITENSSTTANRAGDSDSDGGENLGSAPPTAAPSATHAGGNDAAGDGDSGHESPAAEQHSGEPSETVFGVNPEATPLVVVTVLASVLLALALLMFGSPLLAAAIASAMVAFTALDIREVVHQLDVSRAGVATVAAVVALLHVLAAAAAIAVARTSRHQRLSGGTPLRTGWP